MMGDLISRDYLREIVGRMPTGWEYGAAVSDIYDIIMKAPAVDAVEVVHGQWNVILNPFWDAECSECGYAKKTGWEWGFCPNCGAKMDGGADP